MRPRTLSWFLCLTAITGLGVLWLEQPRPAPARFTAIAMHCTQGGRLTRLTPSQVAEVLQDGYYTVDQAPDRRSRTRLAAEQCLVALPTGEWAPFIDATLVCGDQARCVLSAPGTGRTP